MPTASVARLEKQASLDANDPLRQAIVMIDHKIRNLEKRKGRLDSYRDLQKNGKDLNSDQLEAISKYDAVIAHLDFAKELSKHLTTLAIDSAKNIKKQARKEALERAQQELARTKDILIIQDVLASMGQDAVREDLLNGKAKVTLTAEELQAIDDLYVELTPKRDEPMVFTEMFQSVAETMVTLVDGKNKEAFGTTYSALKAKLLEVASCGYFDTAPAAAVAVAATATPTPTPTTTAPVATAAAVAPPTEIVAQEPEEETLIPDEDVQTTERTDEIPPLPQETPAQPLPTCTFQPSGITIEEPQPAPIETTYFTPSHLRVFKSGTIDFMQENELDIPDSNEPPSIPTMTYTNQSFSPLEVASQQVGPTPQAPAPPPAATTPTAPSALHYQNTDEEKGWSTNTMVVEPQTNVIVTTSTQKQTNAVPQNEDLTGWEEEPQPPQTHDDDWASQTENWSDIYKPQNDGFITAGGSGRGRGGRGRGGGDRNKGGYNNRGGNRGGSRGGYNREGGYINREGGGNYREGSYREGNNYYKDQSNYQNGYQNRGDQPRGGRGGANRGSSDRTGNRGGRGGRGSYRGSNNPGSGGYRQ
ncbi:cell cycle associated protein caprin family member isoform X2 [Rhodnius prolixus]|uniref:cell cycle associated protein caprin family member isoform X2 n=1 Tax=Rhodnius prolixus TaxID=13249 RepID=UPI003D18C1C3